MKAKPRRLAALALFPLMAAAAVPAASQTCTLEYQRADNMWAADGRPDGALGTETLTIQPGQTKVFTTDWKYEKQRNDGTNYYGSHLRIARNTGRQPMKLVLRGDLKGLIEAVRGAVVQRSDDSGQGTLNPGTSWSLKADLMEATCLHTDTAADSGTPSRRAVPMAVAIPAAPTGLNARQASPTEIILTWDKVPDAKEYRVYVTPPPSTSMAGRPGIVGASGSRYVILIPPSVPPSTVYYASVETVGASGAISRRVEFNPVAVMLAQGPAGGPQSVVGAAVPAGQACPAGQFMTGLSSAGTILCARP